MHSSKYSDQSYLCLAQAESGKREGQTKSVYVSDGGWGWGGGGAKNLCKQDAKTYQYTFTNVNLAFYTFQTKLL